MGGVRCEADRSRIDDVDAPVAGANRAGLVSSAGSRAGGGGAARSAYEVSLDMPLETQYDAHHDS